MKYFMQLFLLVACIGYTSCSEATTISGTVKDQNGNPIAGATVDLLYRERSVATSSTNAKGHYYINTTLKHLNQDYKVVVKQKGYQTYTLTQLRVSSYNERIEQDFTLHKHTPHLTVADSTSNYKKKALVVQEEAVAIHAPANVVIADKNTAMFRAYDNASMSGSSIYHQQGTESYKKYPENDFKAVSLNPLSTLSVDVDRASYSNVRRFINQGQKPPADAVRVEEMINYFNYEYPQPQGKDPIAIVTEITNCPWQPQHKLVHIGMQARKIDTKDLPPSNLVFLLDVSGSMSNPNKLPLVVSAMKLLANNLREQDKISIVVYAGSAGLVLPPTSGRNKTAIYEALDKLRAGGSTAGGAGIKLAYKTAREQFIRNGNNRVILATDGDFNVGVSNENELEDLIVAQRDKGIFLTCLGFGTGNYKDSKMELLADKGNGNYAYIDNILEAQKTLVSEFGGTVFTVAKDVKAQIEFNPNVVQGYRLVGYENRLLNEEDFTNDKKDAGDMGSGHSVTIIYEVIPARVNSTLIPKGNATKLKYQQPKTAIDQRYHDNAELATIKFRYKKPDGNKSTEMIHIIPNQIATLKNASNNVRFATAVAMYGMILKDSDYKGSMTYDQVLALARSAKDSDDEGYRGEFIRLVTTTKGLTAQPDVWDY